MQYFSDRFPEIGAAETRCVIIGEGPPGSSGAKYGLVELYCEDLKCDCRKVLIEVFNEASPAQPLATISYGWEAADFYDRKFRSVPNAGRELTQGVLDQLAPQSERAEDLLRLFQEVVIKGGEYVKRLERHYWMFKRSLRPLVAMSRKQRKG